MCSYVRPQNTLWTLLGRIGAQSHICEFQHLGGGVFQKQNPCGYQSTIAYICLVCTSAKYLLAHFLFA